MLVEVANMDESLDAVSKEEVYVHTVYNEIASHFSQTRYKVCLYITHFIELILTWTVSHGL